MLIQIEFLDKDAQNAIYSVACKYEGFEIDNNENVKDCFWNNVWKNNECGYGLEKAISDFILIQNDFSRGKKYFDIVDRYGLEVMKIKHCDDD